MNDGITWNEVVALITIVIVTVGLLIDIGIRIISYTRARQKEFYELMRRISFVEQELRDFTASREKYIKEFRDVQGIMKKANLYSRKHDDTIPGDYTGP